jgi:hypothetical protein
MWNSKSSGSSAGSMSGPLIAVLFVIVAALIFAGVFLLLPGPEHFTALLVIGFLAVLFGAISYLAESISKGPSIQRAASWGFGAFGFAILFLTVGALPFFYSGLISTLDQIALLIVIILMLIVPVAFFGWRARGQAQDSRREEARHEWAQSTPPSAFSYAAARDPAAPSPPSDSPPRGGA